MEQTKQRLQISDPHFHKFSTSATFACWKARFNTEIRTCSQFPTETMQWIKGSGVGWFNGWIEIFVMYSWCFNARFWSTWCKDCFSAEQNHPQNQLREKDQSGGTKSPKENRSLIYEYFRVTGANDSVENYADLFTVKHRFNHIHAILNDAKFCDQWRTESLNRLRTRESEKLKTVLEFCKK